ncbi:MAG: Hsp20/alpha crystallin family protein [Planctomycetota bacterium]
MASEDTNPRVTGKAAIDGILGGLGDILGKVTELAEQAGKVDREGGFKTADGREGRFQVGFNIRTMGESGGEQSIEVEPFGDVSRDRATGQANVSERREPPVDVFEEDDHVLIIVEMPGVGESDATFVLEGDVLTVSAQTAHKRYHKELLLTQPCDAGSMQVQAVNGVFEIRVTRTESEAA